MPQEPSASTIALAPSTEVTPLGLKLPEQMSLEEWEVLGAHLRTITDGVQWAIGDWLVYGEGREEWGHMYERAEKILGIANATLRKYAQASNRWTPNRRRAGLSWSHHYELCALDDAEQDGWAMRPKSTNWRLTACAGRSPLVAFSAPKKAPAQASEGCPPSCTS